jgi:hypothetical protein
VYRSVDPANVVRTVEQLRNRVSERFPGSGLSKIAEELYQVARSSAERALWTTRPLLLLRFGMALLTLLIIAGLLAAVLSASTLQVETHVASATDLVQAVESAVNDVVFVGIGLYFLVSLEGRIKRARVLSALHELRSLAHIIDMHQLTKDPERMTMSALDTPSSPERNLGRFELGRYLDYCSEMLALLGKLAALYAQYTSDPVALGAVDQIEDLTSGLSHKIWQKIVILHQLPVSGDSLVAHANS